MRTTLILAAHSLTRIRAILLGLGLMMAGFEFLLTQVGVYLSNRGAFSQLSALIPDFVRTAAGPSALAFMSFTGIVALGYFHPIVIATLVGLMITIATEPAAEVEGRFVDLTLARPVARHVLITRTLLVAAVSAGLMLGLMIAGTWIGLTCGTPAGMERPSFAVLVSLALSLLSVMGCWAGVALALAAGAKRRATSAAIAGVAALGSYLLDYLGRAWDPAYTVSRLSPFHYFEPMTLVMGQPLSGMNLSVLFGMGVAGSAAAYVLFLRRDI